MSSESDSSFPAHRSGSGSDESERTDSDDGERMPIPSSLSRFVLRTSAAAFAEMVDCAPPHDLLPRSIAALSQWAVPTAGELRALTQTVGMWLRAGWSAVLDTEPRFRSANLALLATGEEHHTVAIVARDDIVPRTLLDTGFDHFAIAFPSAGDVVSSYERLKALGILPWPTHHIAEMSMYYSDPDGNKVELQGPVVPLLPQMDVPEYMGSFPQAPEDDDAAEEWWLSKVTDGMNFGHTYDVEAVLSKFHEGVEDKEVVQYAEPPANPVQPASSLRPATAAEAAEADGVAAATAGLLTTVDVGDHGPCAQPARPSTLGGPVHMGESRVPGRSPAHLCLHTASLHS